MSNKTITVRKSALKKTSVKRPSTPRFKFSVGVPVNVKVAGERTMLKGVTLLPIEGERGKVKVLSGGRGRPRHLPVEMIERVRAL